MGKMRKRSKKTRRLVFTIVRSIGDRSLKRQWNVVREVGQEDPLVMEMTPTPVFLPGEFHAQRKLTGYSSWDHKESDMT